MVLNSVLGQLSVSTGTDTPPHSTPSKASGSPPCVSSRSSPRVSFFASTPNPESFASRPLVDGYKIGTTLGKGKFGKVRAATDRATGEAVAIKMVPKPKDADEMLAMRREVEVMKLLDHPAIVRLHRVVETEEALYLVMEKLDGGEIFDRVANKGPYSEAPAREIARRLLEAVRHLHDKSVVHRDLKPENILLASPHDDVDVRVTDFGLSRSFADEAVEAKTPTVMRSPKGTTGYVAPEILRRSRYSSSVDLWSLGVVVFILLGGYEPFHGATDHDVDLNTLAGRVSFPPRFWQHVSANAKDFIRRLLTVDPRRRPTAAEALRHPWLTGEAPSTWARARACCQDVLRMVALMDVGV